MHECVIKLIGDEDSPQEEEVECLCKLLMTIGKHIDHERAREHVNE